VKRAAEILQLEHLLARRPSQLSGGQSQRVAIGRAIVKEPKAFLFDEPLSNLDAELRVKMRSELIALHRRLKSTMIYVTHDQVEAMTMADQIVVLNEGRVEQVGSSLELYARPSNLFVARFLGAPAMNMLDGRLRRSGSDVAVELATGVRVPLCNRDLALEDGAPVSLGIRPEHAAIGGSGLQIRVKATEMLGSETIIHATTPRDEEFTISVPGICAVQAGELLSVALPDRFIHLFDENGAAMGHKPDWMADYVVATQPLKA
jgi:multiple sugar transport system ATP-binding protein